MNSRISVLSKCSIVAAAAAVAVTATLSLADPPRIGGCWRNVECLDVWMPVICSNGQVYSNSCYAYRACATGCVPYGGEPM